MLRKRQNKALVSVSIDVLPPSDVIAYAEIIPARASQIYIDVSFTTLLSNIVYDDMISRRAQLNPNLTELVEERLNVPHVAATPRQHGEHDVREGTISELILEHPRHLPRILPEHAAPKRTEHD